MMMKLAPIAAVLVAAGGAMAQTCTEKKACAEEGAEATAQVAQVASKEKAGCCEAGSKAEAVALAAQAEGAGCHAREASGTVQVTAVELKGDSCGAGAKACDEPCDEAKAAACAEKGGASVIAASFKADLPRMAYRVGEKRTHCPMTAEELAAEVEASVAYEVGGVAFEDRTEASRAYAEELDAYLDRMTRVSFVVGEESVQCPMSAGKLCEETGESLRYRVGPAVFDSAEEAVKAAAMAYGAAQRVKMSYEVDGEKTSCSATAAKAKSCSETELAYCVGERKTACDAEASALLAMARIEAALAAIEGASGDRG